MNDDPSASSASPQMPDNSGLPAGRPPPPLPPAPKPPPARTAPQDSAGNVKETIESILVAFILAFIFRAFVVEAFVIPTGSMAPTLMGAHMHFTCPDCGYQWDVGYETNSSSEEEVAVPNFAWKTEDGKIVVDRNKQPIPLHFEAHCPNCGYEFTAGSPSAVPVNYGDRILVLKYLYLLNPASRWDVVVFKSPYIPRYAKMDASGAYDYSINYIKRLTGKPGESLMILDGDIYISHDRQDIPDAKKIWLVQTKPRYAQQAMWRIVYNNDFHPLNSPSRSIPWHQPWVQHAGSGWVTGGDSSHGRLFTFTNRDGSGRLEFDRTANPDKEDLTNITGYNECREAHDSMRGRHPVSDLKLDLWYQRRAGSGPIRFELTKLGQTFIAELTPHHAALLHRLPDGRQVELGSAALDDGAGDKPVHIEFQNADYRVTLRIDDRDLIVTTRAQYSPDIKKLVEMTADSVTFPYPAIAIEAAKQDCHIDHIALYRDTYYTFDSANDSSMHWGGPYNLAPGEGGPVHLGPDEYFVCGDNSTESLDARYWNNPIQPELLHNEDVEAQAGRVPARFMLGKALFVYWPAGFRPFGDNSWAMIPDFGKMRFIH